MSSAVGISGAWVRSIFKNSSTRGARVVIDASQVEPFSLHSPSVAANTLREREIAEILVIEVHLVAMSD